MVCLEKGVAELPFVWGLFFYGSLATIVMENGGLAEIVHSLSGPSMYNIVSGLKELSLSLVWMNERALI